jgi:hypothetical protein
VFESHVLMRPKEVSTPTLRSWPCLWSMEAFRTGLHLGELNRRLLIVETLLAILACSSNVGYDLIRYSAADTVGPLSASSTTA